MFVLGYAGMHRRIYNPYEYKFLEHLVGLNRYISIAAFTVFAAQFLFLFNFVKSLIKGEKASANPWNVGTLEWTVPSPPAHHNFDVIPTVYNGPHEYSHPAFKDRDFIYQSEYLEGFSRKPV
jgi:cytochrome c oxidase subunit 1